MQPKRLAIFAILTLSIGAAFAGTLWNRGLNTFQGQVAGGISQVVDDGDAGFRTSGQGWQTFPHTLGYKGDIVAPASAADSALAATWTFSNVTAGRYKFFVTFKAYNLLTNQAPYTIKDGTTVLGSTTVNQKVDPTGNAYDGKNWVLLGTHTVKGPTVSITLSRPQNLTANGVIADAARIERVSADIPATTGAVASPSAAPATGAAPVTTGIPVAATEQIGKASAATQCFPIYPIVTDPSNRNNLGPDYECSKRGGQWNQQMNCCSCLYGNMTSCDGGFGECGCCPSGMEFKCSSFDNCYCDAIQCPPGYHVGPTNICLPDSVCGDGYLDPEGFPKELCETGTNHGCPPGRNCISCKSCGLCGNAILEQGEACEADYSCAAGSACDGCACVPSSTPLTANMITTLDLSSPGLSQSTNAYGVTVHSWTLPVAPQENYDIYAKIVRSHTYNNPCPLLNFWRISEGTMQIPYGQYLCITWPDAAKNQAWVKIGYTTPQSSILTIEHVPPPPPVNGNPTSHPAPAGLRLVRRFSTTDPAPLGVTLVDNGDKGFRASGGVWEERQYPMPDWRLFGVVTTPLFDDDISLQSGTSTNPGGTASWSFTVTPGRYRIFLTYGTLPLNNFINKNAVYSIRNGTADESQKEVGRVTVDQSSPPGGTEFRSVSWRDVGEYNIAGSRLSIVLTNPYGLSADAVRIVQTSGSVSSTFSSSVSSVTAACSPTPWAACSTGFSCLAVCANGTCWNNLQMDCAPGHRIEYSGSCGNTTCGGKCARCVPVASSSRSSAGPACANEGEIVSEMNMRQCCDGLVSRPNVTPVNGQCLEYSLDSICTRCGNGQCGTGENYCNCPNDCLTCTPAGKTTPVLPNAACCPGLVAVNPGLVPQPNGSCPTMLPAGAMLCTDCGNGTCEQWENYCNCPNDCPQPRSSASSVSSVTAACSPTPWAACSTGFSCLAVCANGTCWNNLQMDCAPGHRIEYSGSCGNTTCGGQCARCVPVASSSRSSAGPACANEGEIVSEMNMRQCCDGLVTRPHLIPVNNQCPDISLNTVCTKCGNGTCGLGENFCNCPNDCPQPRSSASSVSSVTAACSPTPWAACSTGFSCLAVCANGTCWNNLQMDCAPGHRIEYSGSCGNTTCGGQCARCVPVASSSRSSAGPECGNNRLEAGEQCDGANNPCPIGVCTSTCQCVIQPPNAIQWQTVGDSYLVSTRSDYALFTQNSYLFLAGGMDFWGASDNVLRSENGVSWSLVGSLPQPLSNAATFQTEGLFMLLGGLAGRDSVVQWAFETPNILSMAFRSNPAYGLPVPRYDAAALRIGSRTYLLGGYYKATPFRGSLLGSLFGALLGQTAVPYPSKELYVHDGTSWTRIQEDLPFHVTKNDAFALGNALFILDRSSPRKVYMSSNGTGWSQVGALPSATSGISLLKPVLHKGSIWLIGRDGSFEGSAVATTDGRQWQIVNGAFPPTLNDFTADSAISFKDELWILGTVSDYYIGGNGRNGKVLKTGAGGGPVCGNGGVEGTERCDDGNKNNGDGCSSTCQIESGWTCSGSPSRCTRTCAENGQMVYGSSQFGPTTCCSKNAGIKPKARVCGDQCCETDDLSIGTCVDNWWQTCGNGTCGTGEDKCSCPADCSECTSAGKTAPILPGGSVCCPGLVGVAPIRPQADGSCPTILPGGAILCTDCGNGICEEWENYCNCPADCAGGGPVCGNGGVEGTERCDDGNKNNGDGCSSTCQIESGWTCSGSPSLCTRTCAQNGQRVYGSSQFGPTTCCSKNAGIKPNSILAGDMCISTNDGSIGTCVDNWWQTCGNGTCGTGEDKCSCPADCPNCIGEGETGSATPSDPPCCAGLTSVNPGAVPLEDGSCPTELPLGGKLCINCGNGQCGIGENFCNCPKDCSPAGPLCGNGRLDPEEDSQCEPSINYDKCPAKGMTCDKTACRCVPCPAVSAPYCPNGILVPQLGPGANGCPLPPVCCSGAMNPQAQCTVDLTCNNGSCLISSCTCR